MEHSDAIGRRIGMARAAARFTRYDLATRLGWSPSKVSELERGTRSLSTEDLELIADACGFTVEQLWALPLPTSPAPSAG